MKLSKSKLALAKVINENGGWPVAGDCNFVTSNRSGVVKFFPQNPLRNGADWVSCPYSLSWIDLHQQLPNWHQCILSREEYYHAYPKADADEKLRVLELVGEAHGLPVTPITTKQDPELVTTDWRDLQAGDVISVSGQWWEPDSEYTVDENDGSLNAPIRVGDYWAFIGECSFKFIRRP